MALTPEQISDLREYKALSSHLVNILDNEVNIAQCLRTLDASNMTKLNSTHSEVLDKIKLILDTQTAPL